MDRINHPTAPGGVFRDRDPATGGPGTTVPAAHMNAVQEELVGVIETAGLAPDASDLGQLAEAVLRLRGGGGGPRNLVINGTFRIWQRGENFTGGDQVVAGPGEYTADRWQVQSDESPGNGTCHVTRGRDAQAPGIAVGVFDFLHLEIVTSPTVGAPAIRTKLEALRQLSGRKATLSYLARASAATSCVSKVTLDGFGQSLVADQTATSVGTDWTPVSVSFDVPAVPEVVGDVDGGIVTVELGLPALGAGTFDLARVQLEAAEVASPFEERDRASELHLCRRYFQRSWPLDTELVPGSRSEIGLRASALDNHSFKAVRLQPEMRATPTVSIYSPDGQKGWISMGGVTVLVLGVADTAPTSMGRVHTNGNSTVVEARFHYTADAEL